MVRFLYLKNQKQKINIIKSQIIKGFKQKIILILKQMLKIIKLILKMNY